MKWLFRNLIKNNNSEVKVNSSSDKSSLFRIIVFGGSGFFISLFVFIMIIVVIFGPVMLAGEYISSFTGAVSTFFEKVGNVITLKGWCTDEECDKPSDQKYNEKLKEVYDSYKEKNIEIDTDLITATIYYGSTFDDKFDGDDGKDSEELVDDSKIHLSDIKSLASNMVSGTSIDYSKYRNYLLNTYVPKRFSDLYENDRQKENIVDEIMMYASGNVNIADGSELKSVYEECPEVCSKDGRCFDLEEFVTRVVDHESGGFISLTSNYAEEWKAQAVAARTVTLYMTNSCKKPIDLGYKIDILDPSSARSQHDKIAEVIKDTAGQILTIDGKPINSAWDSFYKGNNYHCDDNLCYATYQKIGFDGEKYSTHEISSYKKWENAFLGGHGYGLSQYGAAYLADIGWKYTDILKYYYDDRAVLSSMSSNTGTIVGNKYTSNPPMYDNGSQFFKNINYDYFVKGASNYGECPWYAKGRAIEIIAKSNMPEDLKQKAINTLRNTLGNGRAWYSNTPTDLFDRSTDLYAAKPGSIVSWSGGKVCKFDSTGYCGHVGIIEDVQYDSNGKAVKVLMSEGWNNYDKNGRKLGASYSMKWWTIEKLKSYYSRVGKTYYFNGYVYLLG